MNSDQVYFLLLIGILSVFVMIAVVNMWRARRIPGDNTRIADQNLEMLKIQQENNKLLTRQVEALERIAARLEEQG